QRAVLGPSEGKRQVTATATRRGSARRRIRRLACSSTARSRSHSDSADSPRPTPRRSRSRGPTESCRALPSRGGGVPCAIVNSLVHKLLIEVVLRMASLTTPRGTYPLITVLPALQWAVLAL